VNLEEEFEQHRGGLIAHCYRMLGSFHDAEDIVQETFLRAWNAYDEFEHRSSVKTWLHRIATHLCLNALEHSSRRLVPSALGAPGTDPGRLEAPRLAANWLEPLPGTYLTADPASVVGERQSLRLAMVAALQHLPPRQRAVLILRDVLRWPAAEVAGALETTPVAVNSALLRARAELARRAPVEDDLSEPDEPSRRALLDDYAAAFEKLDFGALEQLLTQDVRWEMPPVPTWFSGRDNVLSLLRVKLLPGARMRIMVPTTANGQPAFALYTRGADELYHARYLQVLTLVAGGISSVLAFHRPDLFPSFGLPATRSM
jgi:RNA polymerase sigma-70 factor (ECF subfamily)